MKPSERIKQIKRELAETLHGYNGPNEKLWHAISAVIAYLDEQYRKQESDMEWRLILLRGKKEPREFVYSDSRRAIRTALAWGSLYSAVVTMEAPRESAEPTITVDASLYFDGKLY